MTHVIWFDIDPNNAMRESAGELLDWLDENKICYEWLGISRWKGERFQAAISFSSEEDAASAQMFW